MPRFLSTGLPGILCVGQDDGQSKKGNSAFSRFLLQLTSLLLRRMATTMGRQRLNLSEDSSDRKRSREDSSSSSASASLSSEGIVKKKRSNFSDAPVAIMSSSESGTNSTATTAVPEDVNPLTGLKYSQRYYDILGQRKKLPAWEAKKNFVKLVKKNQVGR